MGISTKHPEQLRLSGCEQVSEEAGSSAILFTSSVDQQFIYSSSLQKTLSKPLQTHQARHCRRQLSPPSPAQILTCEESPQVFHRHCE